jgi:phosphate transport system substrate-binding protein
MQRPRMTGIATALLAVALPACGGSGGQGRASDAGGAAGTQTASATSGADLTGAGSTFAYPLYSKWAADYAAKTGIKVNYQSIGSGGGIRQFSDETVDFGATDGPMSDQELANAKGGSVQHVPTALGADVLMYNLANVTVPLRFSPDIIADVFLGKITKWNDQRIKALNPDAKLPGQDILVVHRSDGSGTTYVWTDYLAAVSPEWAKGPGKGKEVQWPVGIGGKGNEGVAGQVKQTPGALGYVELAYAKENDLPMGIIQNAAGNFVTASTASITAAAAGVSDKLPPNTDYRLSIINAPGAAAYPISSFTWILAYKTQPDATKGKKLVDFLRWALTDGQALEAPLDYAPLPAGMLPQLRARIDSIKVGAGAAQTAARPQ